MHLEAFLALAKDYANLGSVIGQQMLAVATGADMKDQNPGALREAVTFLRKAEHRGVDDAADLRLEIEAHLSARTDVP